MSIKKVITFARGKNGEIYLPRNYIYLRVWRFQFVFSIGDR